MNKLQKALAVGVLAALSGYASAAPVFNFTQTAGFQKGDVAQATYTGDLGIGGINPSVATASTMSWYLGGSSQSSLRVTTQSTSEAGGITTGLGAWHTITTLFHDNNEITWPGPGASPTGWLNQSIFGVFSLYDGATLLNGAGDESETLITRMFETPNVGPCPGPNPLGSTCDDVFTIALDDLDLLDSLFYTANDGSKWRADFRFENFNGSSVDLPNIYTAEGTTSSLDVQVRLVEIVDVPEPASLGILGLGLVGLSLAKRRKENA